MSLRCKYFWKINTFGDIFSLLTLLVKEARDKERPFDYEIVSMNHFKTQPLEVFPGTGVFCEFCEFLKNIIFREHLQEAASDFLHVTAKSLPLPLP